jgi:hypothetical protein
MILQGLGRDVLRIFDPPVSMLLSVTIDSHAVLCLCRVGLVERACVWARFSIMGMGFMMICSSFCIWDVFAA